MSALESIKKLQENMSKSIIGQEKVIERMIIVLLGNGNLLLEGRTTRSCKNQGDKKSGKIP